MIGRRYLLQAPLGEGAMGSVYRAVDRLSGQVVALKQLRVPLHRLDYGSRIPGSSQAVTLAQEFRLLSTLRHPNIISVLDYGFAENGTPYITMELLEGARPIAEMARGQAEVVKTDLLLQLLHALLYLHRRGILHRDLKANNVLVVQERGRRGGETHSRVKVLDFGLSVLNEQARDGHIAGTPAYMAPEVWDGEPASKASDLYSFGIIAYELYAGRRPFEGGFLEDLHKRVQEEAPNLAALRVGNEQVRDMIGWLLSKDPRDRYSDASEVIAIMQAAGNYRLRQDARETRESLLRSARFVGRRAELGKLTHELERLRRGKGGVWLLGGESGVGKSRLLDELRTLALVQGYAVWRGYVDPELSAPYHAWRDILRSLLLAADVRPFEATVLKPLIRDIDTLVGYRVPAAAQVSAEADQGRLFAVVEALVRRIPSPTLILLEDLHWDAGDNVALLDHLKTVVPPLPVLIVASYRDDERPDLPARLPGVGVMRLGRLDSASTAELVEAMLGPVGRDPVLLARLQTETEGNAFFLVETVRALMEDSWRSATGTGPLPSRVVTGGIVGIIRRRLNRVPVRARPLVEVAAVAGRQLDLDLVADALQTLVGSVDLDALLSDCADAMVLQYEDGAWRFAHTKLRDGVLFGLPQERLCELHRVVASALEHVTQYSVRPAAAALAYHWGCGGNAAKEEHYAALAGEQALREGAYDTARAFLERALALHATVAQPRRRQATLATLLGDTFLALRRPDDARYWYEESLALARVGGYHWGVATSLNNLGNVALTQGDYEPAADYFLQALRASSAARAVPVTLNILAGMADLLARAGDKRVALEYVALVLAHPAADGNAYYQSERVFAGLADHFSRDVLDSVGAAGRSQRLTAVVRRILSDE